MSGTDVPKATARGRLDLGAGSRERAFTSPDFPGTMARVTQSDQTDSHASRRLVDESEDALGYDPVAVRLGQIFAGASALSPHRSMRTLIHQVAGAFGASNYGLVRRIAGQYAWDPGVRGKADQDVSPTQASCYWKLASKRSSPTYVHGKTLVIPLLHQGRDPVTKEVLFGITILVRGSNATPFVKEPNARLARLAGRYLVDNHRLLLALRTNDSTLRLGRLASQLTYTRDIAYQIAKEVRLTSKYDGECVFLRWVPTARQLHLIAQLPAAGRVKVGAGVKGAMGASNPPVERNKLLSWTAEVPIDALLECPSMLLTCEGQQTDGATSLEWAIDRVGGGQVDRAVSPEAKSAAAQLSDYLDADALAPGCTRLITPLAQKGQLLGIQIVSGSRPRAFSSADVTALAQYAQFIMPALTRDQQLEAELRDLEREATLESGADDDDDLAPQRHSLRAILALLCDRIRRHMAADQVVVVPYDFRRAKLDPGLTVSVGESFPPPPPTSTEPGGTAKAALFSESGELEWHRATAMQGIGRYASSAGIESFYAISLRVKRTIPDGPTIDQPIGILYVNYSTPKGKKSDEPDAPPRFSLFDKTWLRHFARIATNYLSSDERAFERQAVLRESSSLYQRVSQLELETQPDLSTAVTETLDRVLDTAIELVRGTAGILAVPCDEHADLAIRTHRNLSEHPGHISYGQAGGVTGRCAEWQRPIAIGDSSDPATHPLGVLPLPFVAGSRSEVAVPLIAGHGQERRLIGVLDIENQTATYAFDEQAVAVLRRLAHAAVLTLELARQIGQLRSLKLVGERIDQADSPPEVFETLLPEAKATTGAFAVSARLLDTSGRYLEPILHLGVQGSYANRRIDINSGVAGWVYRRQLSCVIHDLRDPRSIEAQYPGLKPLPSRSASRSELCVPITWRGDRIGIVNLEHVQVGALTPFVDYVRTLAAEAAYVLWQQRNHQRARRLHDQELVTGVTQFAAGVAHDVKRYFTNIESMAADLGRDGGPLESRQLSQIVQEARDGAHEAESLLHHATDPIAAREYVDLAQIVRSVIDDLGKKQIRAKLSIDTPSPGGALVLCKPAVLPWVVKQIVNNSIAYGKPGPASGPPVRVDVAVRLPKEGTAIISIENDGPEVADETLREMYAWQKDSLKPTGSGLSLPLVRSLVGAMGGTITPRRRGGGGLITEISLPTEMNPVVLSPDEQL